METLQTIGAALCALFLAFEIPYIILFWSTTP